LLVDGNDEVRGHRRIDGTAGRLAQHDGNLRAAARQRQLTTRNLRVHRKRCHGVLNTRAAGVLNADDRATDLDRHVHDLADLLPEGHAN
jgi:hypothetical protein